MATIITRLFKGPQEATDAVAYLKKVGFKGSEITLVQGGAADAASTLVALNIPPAHVKVYADKIAGGASAVTVAAPSGTAQKATIAFGKLNPIDSGIANPDVYLSSTVSGPRNIIRGAPTARLLDPGRLVFGFGAPIIKSGRPWFGGVISDGKPFFGGVTSGKPFSWFGLPLVIRDKSS